jgi:hypothetical protein
MKFISRLHNERGWEKLLLLNFYYTRHFKF